jgi:16S rRNA C967 or C1407 C5-methylase (RsmB/RsmF family)
LKDKIPEFLINLLTNQYGDELTKKIIEGYSKKRIVSIRVNTIKASKNEIESKLKMNNIDYSISDFYEDAFIIKNVNENKIEELEIFKEGKIYMQSLSSMLPPIILDTKENEDILDMTAAPGGKTTQIAALTNNNAHITACEMNNIRLERLKYNVEKQGATSVYVMKQDSRRIDDFFSFDKILLDAPCSGSGTLNVEDENLQKYFTETLIEKSKKAQLELLKKAIKILKPGHEMVYSTC